MTGPLFPDDLLDRYEPLGALGEGAMGVVFRVRDRRVDREAALKLLRVADRPDARKRFRHEAAMLARLRHPAILEVYDFGEVGADMFMVTELLEGASLDQLPAPTDPLAWMLPIAEALDVVHAAGLVHRDVKPANIFRTQEGRLVLLDFGLALDPDVTRQTVQGAVVGTVAYMAPEVLRLEDPGPPADWFAWGVSLFRLVEGDLPFRFEDLMAAAGGESLSLPTLEASARDPAMRRVLEGTLRADPATRLGGAAAIRAAMAGPVVPAGAGAASPAPPSKGGRLRAGLALAGLALLAVLAWVGVRPSEVPSPPPPVTNAPEISARERALADAARALSEELTANGTRFFRGKEVREFPSGVAQEGWTPVLSRDFRDWMHLTRHSPALADAFRWLRREGDRSHLSPEVWAQVEDVDRRYRNLGLPRMITPYLEGDLDPVFRPTPEETEGLPELRSLGEMRGPAGVAFLAWRRVRGWKKRQDDMLDRYPDTGELPPGMAPELVDVGRIPVQLRVRSVLDLAATDHRRRILVHRWMGDPAEQVRRFLYWAHRALGQSRQPKLLALAVSTSTSHLKPLFFSELATLPDYLHVEGGPGGLAKQVMQAAAHRQMAEIRRDLALPWRVFAERRVARLPRALERDSGSGAFGPDLRRRAVQELIQAHLELEQNEAALEVHRFHAALADAGPGRYHLAAVVRRLGPVWEKLPEAPATRAVIPAVLTGLEAIEAEGFRPGDDGLWAEAGRIRARFGK